MVRFLPRSTRWRVALFAALASALVLGLGSYWFVQALRSRLETSANQLASEKARAIGSLLDAGVKPVDVARQLDYVGYWIGPDKSSGCPDNPDNTGTTVGLAVVYTPDCVLGWPFAGENTVISQSGTLDQKHFVRASVPLDPVGLQTVDTAQRILWGGVPAAALFIGGVAWFAVRRSLRAVGTIRAEVDEVRAGDLARRVPVPDSGDEITQLAVTMNEMLARLDRSVRRQSQFTADASHELRTPLASMRTQLEVQLAHPDRLDWRHSIENAVLDVTRMEALSADLLLLSKLDADQPVPGKPVALADLVTEHVAARIPRPGVEIVTRIEAMPVVHGHAGRLERVLRNLVDNAEQHAKSRVTITLTASVLTVDDDGPGIPAEHRERVFDRFVRLDDDRAREEGGSGLGLAIAAEIARTHGGALRVTDSTSGARLEFRLPLA